MKWGCVETRKIQSEELWVSDQWWMSGVGKAGDDLPNVIRTPPALQTFPTGGERRRGIGRPATHARFQCWAKRKSGNINWCSAQPVIAVEWRRRMDLFSRGEILDSPGGQSSIPFPDSALLATPHHCTALTCSTYLLDQGPKYANLTSFLKWERRISLWPQREKTGLILIPDICHFFYTHAFWDLNILHSKVRKFATKNPSRQNSVNLRRKLHHDKTA